MPKIGFVILSHQGGDQLARLVRTLNKLYDAPPITCHHDFGQSEPSGPFPNNVSFVNPHLKTGWGKVSLVLAALKALRDLYEKSDPDWFFLLSAADYPISSPARVLRELEGARVDAFLDHRNVTAGRFDDPQPLLANPALHVIADPANLRFAWRRYRAANIYIPIIRRGPRLGKLTIPLPFPAWPSPWTSGFECFYGDQWFTANSKAASILLNPTKRHLQLQRFLAPRIVPDECYYQSVLCNAEGIRINPDNKRFAVWKKFDASGGARPELLSESNLEAMLSSGAYFARKFAGNTSVLDEIDRKLS